MVLPKIGYDMLRGIPEHCIRIMYRFRDTDISLEIDLSHKQSRFFCLIKYLYNISSRNQIKEDM